MSLDTRPRAPRAVRWIVHTLEDAGHETWAVGGAVRDALLGHPGGDWDLATRARPDEVRRIFSRTVPIGLDHGTVGVLTRRGVLYEVTTFRRDVESYGRHARVEYADEIETDLARRDFTVNAIAWHPVREELRDPYRGIADLEAHVLRTVGSPEARFREDYLRVLRALRFAGRFELRIEADTWTALCAAVGRLHELSAERIGEELEKVLSGSTRPSAALSLYGASGVLAELYPELDGLLEWREGDRDPGAAWTRGLLSADAVPAARPLLRLTAVLAPVGRPGPGELRPLRGPDPGASAPLWERGALRSAAILERLRFSNARIRRVGEVVEALLRPRPDPTDPPAVRRWLAAVGRDRLRDVFRVLVAGARVDRSRGRADGSEIVGLWRAARGELRAGVPLEVGELELDGGDLIGMGLDPGPRFGVILDRLLERVLEAPELNEPGALRDLVRGWIASDELLSEGGEGRVRE